MNQRIAIAVSGSGRSLENFLERQAVEAYKVAAVIASRPDCRAVVLARSAGIELFLEDFTTSRLPEIGPRLYAWLTEHEIALVALAGFIKRFPVAPSWEQRVLNIHPSLLPRHGGRGMYGERVHNAVLASGDRESGATVHYVNQHYDEGSIIEQARVPVLAQDTAQTLALRVFQAECELYPRIVSQILLALSKKSP